jgi:hypothetical protein
MLSEEIFRKGSHPIHCGHDLIGLLLTLIDRMESMLSKHGSVLKRSYYASYDHNFIY